MMTYDDFLIDFKKNFLTYIPLSIILQSCIGSVAAMYILMGASIDDFPFFQLGLCVIVSMAYNASIMAQLNKKIVFNLLILSLVVNILLVIFNY